MACSKVGHTCGCSGGCSGCSGTCTCSGGCSCGSGCTCGSNCSGTCSSTCSGGCKATCADSCENTCTSACKNFKRYSGGSWIGVSEHLWKYEDDPPSYSYEIRVRHDAASSVILGYKWKILYCTIGLYVYETNWSYNGWSAKNRYDTLKHQTYGVNTYLGEVKSKYDDLRADGPHSVSGPNPSGLKSKFNTDPNGYNKYFDSDGIMRSNVLYRAVYTFVNLKDPGIMFAVGRVIDKMKAYKNGSWVGLGYKE